jgi:Domain of unknown function (DUF4180)
MNIFIHDINETQVAEVQSEGIMIRSARDAADITRELLAHGISKLILHERNLCPEFWQTSNGLAGVILQEFTSKSVVVAFVGKPIQNRTENLAALVQESGLGNQAFVLDTVELAKERLSAK